MKNRVVKRLSILFAQVVVVSLAVLFSHSLYARFGDEPLSYRDAIGRVLPSVVSINGYRTNGNGDSITGTGVIVSNDGHILTNYHLIVDVESIVVQTADKSIHDADLIGISPDIDIAVLKINTSEFPAIAASEDKYLRQGDVVFAIGNPFGLEGSASMGIVSAVGRTRLGLYDNESFIQTDAAINPGSSGGPLTNTKGQMVGINSALYYRQHGVLPQGIGFAIPVGLAIDAYDEIINEVQEPDNVWGASVRRITDRLRKEIMLLDYDVENSFLVIKVWEASVAKQAGLQVGDILLSINDKNMGDYNFVTGYLPEDAKRINILRNGKQLSLDLPSVSFIE